MIKELQEMLTAVFLPLVIALQSIAKSLEGARVAQQADKPVPAASPAPPTPPVVDDMGLGIDEPKAVEHTPATIKAHAQETARAKGRPHVKAALTAIGATSVDDVKKEHYVKFVELLDKPVTA